MSKTYDNWAAANETDRRIVVVGEGDYSVREVESAMDGRGPRGW